LSQSNGTATLAHSMPLPGGSHVVQLITALPTRGPGLAAAELGTLRDTATTTSATTASAAAPRRLDRRKVRFMLQLSLVARDRP
jgi:hypothetical protein